MLLSEMDANGNMNLRNWGFLEPPGDALKRHLGLQLMSSMAEKPLFGGGGGVSDHYHTQTFPVMASTNGGPFHHHRVNGISEPHFPMDYWMNQSREKDLVVIYGNQNHGYYQSNYGISSEISSAHSIQMPQPINMLKTETVISGVDACEERDSSCGGTVLKKRGASRDLKSPPKDKKPRTKTHRTPKDEATPSAHHVRAPKKRAEVMINGRSMDISKIPVPICSCTGTPHQCYRWGSGGWQSACCTTGLSIYPLPMSTKRRGARIAGRKMSIGAFKKVLEKLSSEGYDFSSPIDLKSYWAKHGTNKFVTIR